jgi:lipopolysaccharide export LptBFGC system permease protein LptF
MNTLKNITVLIIFFLNLFLYSQDKEFNFIISIDNNLRDVYASRFIVKNKDNNTKFVNVNFVQGNITIKEDDFKILNSENVLKIDMEIINFENIGKKNKKNTYEIEDFKLNWLTKGTFFILYIYNTNKKKNNLLNPLPNKNFTFEYDWSEGSMNRVRKAPR